MDISIIVPVYNVSRYIGRCMNSLLEQDIAKYEILLIDDGSTDSSGEICDFYGSKYDNVRVLHKENEGLGLTRNCGIRIAKGDYILFVDSDDYIEKNVLKELLNKLRTDDLDICFFGRIKKTKDGVGTYDEKMPTSIENYKKLATLCLGEPLKHDLFEIGPAWKAIYNKGFLLKNNIIFESEREVLSEDYIFSAEICAKNPKAGFINKGVYCYCDNGQSLTNSYRSDRHSKAIVLYKRMNQIIKSNMLGEEAKLRAYNNFIINIMVSFKHIILFSGFSNREKIRKISEICNDKEIVSYVKNYKRLDTVKLRLLRKLVLLKQYNIIYLLIEMRYKQQ